MISFRDSSSRFLILERDAETVDALREILAQGGIEVDHASSADEAFALHARNAYRIILGRGAQSIELCRRIREIPGPYAFFLLLTKKADRKGHEEAELAGVDDFLSLPLDADEIGARLRVAKRLLASEDRGAERQREGARTEQSAQELAECLRLSSRRFEDLFSGLPVACFTFDTEGRVHEWNRAAEESFGIAAFDTLMRPVWDVFAHSHGAWSSKKCVQIFEDSSHTEFDWTHEVEGFSRDFTCRIIVLKGRSGKPVGAICAHVDVTTHKRAEQILSTEKTKLEIANARLKDLASRDGLTGLWNRRSFLSDLDAAIHTYRTTGSPFSLVLLDIDDFKAYNDTYGHPAGDEVLRRFARILRTMARSTENPARYGGEEFAIVLHGTEAPKGMLAAERFRKAVEEGDWVERGVTCSLGVASVVTNGTTAEELISAADLALYASKQQGRNRCSHAIEAFEKIAA
jgi:two-component system cell cycle response regulator